MAHRWTPWRYRWTRCRWERTCTVGVGMCTAVETAARGKKPGGRK